MQKKNRLKDDVFYRQIFKLVLPIVIQNLLSAAVSSADVVMLNYVGQSSISAVSLASQYANVLFMVFYGLGTGATMLCAQYYGKGDMKAIQVVEGIALRFSLGFAMLFAGAAFFFPEGMMRLFTNDGELIAIGASYLRFMSVSYLCWGIIEVYLAVLRSIGRVTVSTAMNVLAFSLNIVLNAVFIFGLFGAPKLLSYHDLQKVSIGGKMYIIYTRNGKKLVTFSDFHMENAREVVAFLKAKGVRTEI